MADDNKFIGIVHYHGIGEQSRYESISGLVESFEDYIKLQGETIKIDVGLEYSKSWDKSVTYIKVMHKEQEYRFYEVYWAPITAGGTSGLGVFLWMLKQIGTPLSILSDPWSTRHRMRRGYLYALWEDMHPEALYLEQPFDPTLDNLLRHYDKFCEHQEDKDEAESAKNDGSFADFKRFLKAQGAEQAEFDLADRWKLYVRSREQLNLGILITLGYAIVFIPLVVLGPVLPEMVGGIWHNLMSGHILPKSWMELLFVYLPVFLFIATAMLISHFLRYFGGDVQFWATYEETNERYVKRKEILERGRSMLAHVLGHEDCESVVVISHSLGTPISMDSLLAIGRNMRSVGIEEKLPVENISAYITLASPIDKIHYFFESRRGNSRHFESIVDTVRGDIGSNPSPFIVNGERNFRWFNFWDGDDYISGPVYTPFPKYYIVDKNHEEYYVPQILNLKTDNYHFPAPGRAHGGYFIHNEVFAVLYQIVFDKNPNPSIPRHFYQRGRPENPTPYHRVTDAVRVTLPKIFRAEKNGLRDVTIVGLWALLISEIMNWFGFWLLWLYFQVLFLLVVGSLIVLGILSIWRGHLHPFKKNIRAAERRDKAVSQLSAALKSRSKN